MPTNNLRLNIDQWGEVSGVQKPVWNYITILRVDISAPVFAEWARAHKQGEVSQIPLRAAQRMIPGYKTVYSTCLIYVPRAARGHLTPGKTAIFRNVNFRSWCAHFKDLYLRNQKRSFNILQIWYYNYKCPTSWKIISDQLLSPDSWIFWSVNFP